MLDLWFLEVRNCKEMLAALGEISSRPQQDVAAARATARSRGVESDVDGRSG